MASNKHDVDIDLVKKNALEQGVNLQEISLFYSDLTNAEKVVMYDQNLMKHDNDNAVIASFTESGAALFPEKISGVHYLAA